MSSTIFTDLDPAEAKKWADEIDEGLKGKIGTLDGFTIILHPSQAIELAKPYDPDALDDDEEVEAQPKTERMRDWKQK